MAITIEDSRLTFQAFYASVESTLRLRFQPFASIQKWAQSWGAEEVEIDRLLWAFRIGSSKVPGRTCLSDALALQRFLSRYRHASVVRIGVKNVNNRLLAHAWLLSGGEVLIGGRDLETYRLLAEWDAKEGKHQ